MSRPDQHGNWIAREGCDRCWCGCKYWENDRCVDCNAHVTHVTGGTYDVRADNTDEEDG